MSLLLYCGHLETEKLTIYDPASSSPIIFSELDDIHGFIKNQSDGPEAMCNGGKLGLVSCGDPASQWYATGGQLISLHCYALGYSSMLSVDEGCNDLFVCMTTPDNAITRAQTFLAVTQDFIESIPPAPTDGPVGVGSFCCEDDLKAKSNMNDLV